MKRTHKANQGPRFQVASYGKHCEWGFKSLYKSKGTPVKSTGKPCATEDHIHNRQICHKQKEALGYKCMFLLFVNFNVQKLYTAFPNRTGPKVISIASHQVNPDALKHYFEMCPTDVN